MPAIPSGAGDLANTLLPSLTAGKDFSVPTININSDIFNQPGNAGALAEQVEKISIEDLTTGAVGGSGSFDKLMVSLVNHLKVEFEANRISGAEYTKAYIGVVGAALSSATQFLLSKDQSFWSALLVQQQARTAEVQIANARVLLETAKIQLSQAQYEAAIAEANYALTKLKLSTEDAMYAGQVAQTALTTQQTEHAVAETAQTVAQTVGISYTNTDILPVQKAQAEASTEMTIAQTVGVTYTNANILTGQKVGLDFTNANILPKQATLLGEQIEVQRAQTLNERTDLATITGLIGKQKDLYSQQITSYQRDAETKAVKIFTDSWITQKTIDEGLTPPDQFTNTNINEMLLALRANLMMGS
ncbi:hypothetical protein NKJ04_17555 [Mesorhizobium sp. M0618]|uniref:hypothetical protein n=1 Tax=Mesorhizobium sp. M0618 TaxID=2956972 RepID=UPI00333BB2B6